MTARRRWVPPQLDIHAIRVAKEGDFGPLADRLRSNADLSPELRQLAADIVEGKLKRPRHRQKQLTTLVRHLMMAARVRELAGKDGKQLAAVLTAASEFRCEERTIRRAIGHEQEFFLEQRSKCGPDGRMPAAAAFKFLYEFTEELNRRLVDKKWRLNFTRKRMPE